MDLYFLYKKLRVGTTTPPATRHHHPIPTITQTERLNDRFSANIRNLRGTKIEEPGQHFDLSTFRLSPPTDQSKIVFKQWLASRRTIRRRPLTRPALISANVQGRTFCTPGPSYLRRRYSLWERSLPSFGRKFAVKPHPSLSTLLLQPAVFFSTRFHDADLLSPIGRDQGLVQLKLELIRTCIATNPASTTLAKHRLLKRA